MSTITRKTLENSIRKTVSNSLFRNCTLRKFQNQPKHALFSSDFSRSPKKTCFPKRSENATSFSTCSQKCYVFQQFFAFPGKSCLPKRSENFKISPQMPCFPAIFRALQKKRVFQNALKTQRLFQHVLKNAMFCSNFSFFQENRAFQNALKISKMLCFPTIFRVSRKIVPSETL